MTTLTLTETTYEELAARENNGIRVSLMWSRAKKDAKVTVYDASDDSSLELGVEDAPPLEVFNHPYAYSAYRAVASGSGCARGDRGLTGGGELPRRRAACAR